MNRAAGILLHATSLPGAHGIGDLGRAAFDFVDWLGEAGIAWWQMLPVVPPGAGNSPYKATSAFAGNPMLISLERLAEEGLLTAKEAAPRTFSGSRVDFEAVAEHKEPLLRRAYAGFTPDAGFEEFRAAQAHWLPDFARFSASREKYRGQPWSGWPAAAGEADSGYHEFVQYMFWRQWTALRAHCRATGVRLMGDLPIFVAHDSADVWAHRDLFFLDRRGRPTVVAGVPPDYFSKKGQLWGNPLYDWAELQRTGYGWWLDRLRTTFSLFDAVRLDHFIGFHNYWEIPAGAEDARVGRWVKGPGADFFHAVIRGLGRLELVAEDLGVLTPDVEALRDRFGLPGIRVLQFSFGDDVSMRPFRYPENSLAYTGTHDNDTVAGWLAAGGREVERGLRYALAGEEPHWAMIRLAWMSASRLAVVPAQDVLGLGSEARMNVPGTPKGNWGWRLPAGALGEEHAARLRDLGEIYAR